MTTPYSLENGMEGCYITQVQGIPYEYFYKDSLVTCYHSHFGITALFSCYFKYYFLIS